MFRFVFQIVIVSLVSGCIRYIPRPIDPPALEQSYRNRSLSDSNLQAFFNANSLAPPQSWPPQSLDLEGLTVLALYFSPDLDEARSQIAAAEAAIATARARPNPSVLGGGGYTDAEQSPYAFRFDLDVAFETAGKKQYRVRRAQQLTEAARFSLGETAWGGRYRLRPAVVDQLVSGWHLEQRS